MFVLTIMEDQIRVVPKDFDKDRISAITEVLNKKYGNKVFPNVGLGIVVHDILAVGDAFVYPMDGAAHIKCRFRFVVFRPFIDEIIVGRIVACSPEGARVSVGFFDNIHIPREMMPDPSEYDEAECLWVWLYEDHRLPLFIGEDMRFRVRSVDYDTSFRKPATEAPFALPEGTVAGKQATGTKVSGEALKAEGQTAAAADVGDKLFPVQPMTVVGSLNEDGLGLLVWWKQQMQTE